MKILLINNVGTRHAGAEVMIDELQQGLQARGHTVRLLAGSHGGNGVRLDGWRFWTAADHRPLQKLLFMWNPFAVVRLRWILRRYQPDVVHLHNISKASPWLLRALQRHPTVLTVHDHTVFDPTRLHGLPTLAPYAAALQGYFTTTRGPRWAAERLRFGWYRRWYGNVDVVLACSQFYAAAARESGLFSQVRTVPNGIALPERQPLESLHTMLYVGRLDDVKGAQVLLESLPTVVAQHPQAQLVLVGGGPLEQQLRQRASQLGVQQHVQFLGYQPGAAVRSLYQQASLVVVPSLYPDNFPTVCLEAMGVGRAVVATRVGGLPEMVLPGKTGALVPPGDIDALATQLIKLLGNERQLKRLGSGGRRRADEHFSARPYVAKTLAVYNTAIRKYHR